MPEDGLVRNLPRRRETPLDSPGAAPARLCDFLQGRREQILRAWAERVRGTLAAEPLSEPALRDHVPELLDRLVEVLRDSSPERNVELGELPRIHALQRLDVGFDLRAVCAELAALRETVLGLFQSHARGRPADEVTAEIRRLDSSLDEVIVSSTVTYAAARERTLVAIERLSAAALGTGALDEFLPRLLAVLLETTEAADFVSLFLREGERLVQRAFVGREAEAWKGEELRLGIGLAGAVAANAEPVLIHDASQEQSLDATLRKSGIRAVYAVPLVHDQQVVGVAKMGSKTAFDFPAEDLQLFRAMAQRATSLIVQAQLVAEIQRQRALLDALVQQLPVGVAVAEAPSGRLVRVNAAFEAIWGRGGAVSQEGYDHYVGLHPDGRRFSVEEWPLVRALRRGELVCDEEIEIRRADGSRRVTLQSSTPIRDAGGEVVGAVVTLLDITHRKLTEETLQREIALRDRMLSILGHDLRNPLNAIVMTAHALLRGTVSTGERAAARILAAAQRATEMLEQLIDFARAGAGDLLPISRRRVDLVALVGAIIEEIHAAHPDVSIHFAPSTTGDGAWDDRRLGQLLTNLLVNAVRHGDASKPITVELEGDGDWVQLTVRNEGPTIPADLIPNLFLPFRRGARGEGLGLGLFISAQIAKAHGGDIELLREGHSGTAFRVRLPRHA